MELEQVIRDLQKRRAVLDEAISVFQRLVEAEKQEKREVRVASKPRKSKRKHRKR